MKLVNGPWSIAKVLFLIVVCLFFYQVMAPYTIQLPVNAMAPDAIQKDYGRRLYMSNDSYQAQMRKPTDQGMFQQVDGIKQSEFKKPYKAKTEESDDPYGPLDYGEMEYWFPAPVGFDSPSYDTWFEMPDVQWVQFPMPDPDDFPEGDGTMPKRYRAVAPDGYWCDGTEVCFNIIATEPIWDIRPFFSSYATSWGGKEYFCITADKAGDSDLELIVEFRDENNQAYLDQVFLPWGDDECEGEEKTWANVGSFSSILSMSSIQEFEDNLYVGVCYFNSGAADYEAKVYRMDDVDSWTDVGTPWQDDDGEQPSDMEVHAGKLYVCKQSADQFGLGAAVYRMDGVNNWTSMGTPLYSGTSPAHLYRLEEYNANLYVCGSNGDVSRFDGVNNWTTMGRPGVGQAYRLVEHDGNMYCSVLDYHVYRFDGVGSWTDMGQVGSDTIRSMVSYNGKLYAGTGGSFIDIAKIYRFDGVGVWTEVGSFGESKFATPTMEVFDNYLYVGVTHLDLIGDIPVIYRYDSGSSWTLVGAIDENNIWAIERMKSFGDYLYGTFPINGLGVTYVYRYGF